MCKVFGEAPTALEKLSAGHLALKLIPEAWPELGKKEGAASWDPMGCWKFTLIAESGPVV